jgi:protein required for attachment to host cells
MPTTWIITANAGRARFFAEKDPAEPLQELEDMVNNGARLRTQESETDRLGPTSAGKSSHNIGGTQGVAAAHNAGAGAPNKQYEPNQTPVEHATELFAKDISQFLMKSHQEGLFDQIVLSASPQFLGTLRMNFDPHLKQLIKTEINKDYTSVASNQLREQLQAQQAKSE